HPARAQGLFERHPREFKPELVGVVDPAVCSGSPDDSRNEISERPVLFLAGAEGFPRFFEDADRRLGLGRASRSRTSKRSRSSSACLRSVMSTWEPAIRYALPAASRRATPRARIQR